MGTANSRMDTSCFTPATLSFTKQKGTAFLLSSSPLTIHLPFQAKDRNKDNGKKDIIITHTELLFLRSV